MRRHPARRDFFEELVAVVAQGLPLRGVERAKGKALSKSATSRMKAEKSREQLELLRNRPLTDADWLAVLTDGVWLTRELWKRGHFHKAA
jgi:putative transposase